MSHQLKRLAWALTTVHTRDQLKQLAKALSSIQLPTNGDNIFIFATPRSGSTWLMELILSQPGFRACDEPLDLRKPYVRRHLGMSDWVDLYQKDTELLLQPYFQKICDGRIRGLITLWNHRRLVSRRLVFKIHNCEDRIQWMCETFGGQAILLIRHPVAVTVSRKRLPRLEAFVNSDYARHFSAENIQLAKQIIATGSFFEKGIVHWCFENAVLLRTAGLDPAIVTYEELVTDPMPVLWHLSSKLNLPNVELMRKHLNTPSRTTSKATSGTQEAIEAQDRWSMVTKWRRQISDEDERRAFDIVDAFGIDIYEFGRDMPCERYLIGSHDKQGLKLGPVSA